MSHGPGYSLFFRETEFEIGSVSGVTHTKQPPLRFRLEGANPTAAMEGLHRATSISNYYRAAKQAKAHTGLANFNKLLIRSVYPGIDLLYYSNKANLEYDFIVAPGADPKLIRISVNDGADPTLSRDGDLVLRSGSGWIRQLRPKVYQEIDGVRKEIASQYTLSAGGLLGFQIGRYDHSRTLTIDPVLDLSTFSGFDGGGERTLQFAVDAAGNTYVAGPAAGSASTGDDPLVRDTDVFVAKHSPSGELIYSTYVGGAGDEFALGLVADSAGRLVVGGITAGSDFTPTPGAYAAPSRGEEDAWVGRLDPQGKVEFLAVFGGIGSDQTNALALDRIGNIWFTGQTASGDFPVTLAAADAPEPGTPDAFVAQLSEDGRELLFSRRIGGTGSDRAMAIALDGAGRVIIAGTTSGEGFPTSEGAFSRQPGGGDDAFVAQLNQRGDRLRFSTLIGGTGDDAAYALVIGPNGDLYVAGGTTSPGFPALTSDRQTAPQGGEDAFVVRLDSIGSEVIYGTLIGGTGFDRAYSIAVDELDNAYVTGLISESVLPEHRPAPLPSPFVAKVSDAGELLYSAPLGDRRSGAGTGLALSSDRSLVVAGYFAALDEDAAASQTFIAKVNLADPFCPLKISPPVANVSPAGGSVAIEVLASSGCSWTVSSNVGWIHFTETAGMGSKTISLEVDPTVEDRIGIVDIGDQRIRITQSRSIAVSPPAPRALSAVRLYAVNGATPGGGQHPASTLYTMNPNTGAILSTIGSTTYQIVGLAFRPSDGVLFGVTANQASLARRLVTINLASGAATAVSGVDMGVAIHDLSFDGNDLYGWSGSHGAGSGGERLYRINTATGTVQTSVAGAFSLAAGSGLALSPNGTLYQVGPTGSTLNTVNKVNGSVTPGPALSGTSDFRFLSLAFSPSGELLGITRPGGLQIFDANTKLVAVNTASGQITTRGNTGAGNISAIAFQLCTGSVAPTTFTDVAQAGSSLSVTITTSAGCFWSVSSNASWITPNVTSGSGSATVSLMVAANAGGPRTGTVTVAGETISVSQAGVPNSCPATVSPNPVSAGPAGGTQVETVVVAGGCTWTAVSNSPWITFQGAVAGTGSGSVTLSFAANAGPPRTGTVSIAGQTITVNQQSPSNACPTALFPAALTAGANGSAGHTVQVTNQTGCSWVTSSNAGWITVTNGAIGSGPGSVTFSIAPNTGAARTGTVNIGGQIFDVSQQATGTPCFATLGAAGDFLPNGFGIPAAPITRTLSVSIQAGCGWATTGSIPWITFSNSSGAGTGSMQYTIAANSGPARTATFTVAGREFTVFQEGLITSTLYGTNGTPRADFTTPASTLFTLNPSTGASLSTIGSTGFPTNGLAIHPITGELYATTGRLSQAPQRLLRLNRLTGAGTVVGALGAGIHELAFDSDGTLFGWGASFNGGDYDLHRIDINTGVATRVGESAISVANTYGAGLSFDYAGELFYANQLSLAANFYKVNKVTGTLTQQPSIVGTDFKVVALDLLGSGSLLALTHVSQDRSQIANLSLLNRATGALTPIGRTVDYLNGIAALNCIGLVSPDKQQVSGAGGSVGAAVVVSRPCNWSAQSNVAWITFPQASGTGTSALFYTAAPNSGAPRTGTITVAGQSITVSQDGGLNACPATLASSTQTVNAASGGTTVGVTVGAGCAWSAVSNAEWITVAAPANQSGPGTASLQFTQNTGAPRTGTVSIAGQSFTLIQRSPANFCAAAIDPASQVVAPAGGNVAVGVTVAANCAWSATTALPWVTITGGASGAGNGTVAMTVSAHSGASDRGGTVAIGGQTFTLTQRTPINFCPATLTPGSQQAPAAGGSFQIGITVAGGCQWTITGGAPWLTLTGPAAGTGSTTTSYSLAANTGYARSVTLSVAGQTFRIVQAGPLTGTLYVSTGGGGGSDARLYQIEPSTGNVIADIGSIGYPVTGLAFHPVTRQLYGTTNNRNVSNGRKLIRINRTTAAATEVGNLALADGSLHDIAFDSSGNLYAVSSQRNLNDLYRVDITNAALTKVGEAYPFQVPGNATAFGPDGTLFYGARAAPETPGDPRAFLNTLSTVNGVMTPKVQVSGRTLGEKFSGFDFDAYGTMYGFVLPEQFATPSNLVTVNTVSGVITTIGRTIDSANALAFYPSTCAFFAAPSSTRIPLAGGNLTVSVSGAPECSWSVASNASWLQVSTPPGPGNGSVTVTVQAAAASRTGTVTIAGKVIQITQTNGTSAIARNVGVFRSGFYWLLDVDGDTQFASPPDRAFGFGGIPGDVPITGDWNGDGKSKVGAYRSSNGLFILDYNGDGQFTAADRVYDLGVGVQTGDVPVVGDWNGNGRTKVGLFRQGFYWILDTTGNGVFEAGQDQAIAFGGVAGDKPVVGDWNSDGRSKIGLFRQGFFWILDYNGNGVLDAVNAGGDRAFAFGGLPGDVPVVADWSGDGISKPGIFRAGFFWVTDANGNYQFDGVGSGQDKAFPFGGIAGDVPVLGKW